MGQSKCGGFCGTSRLAREKWTPSGRYHEWAWGVFVECLTRYDVAEYNGVKMVVVESDLLPPDPAVVVIPLLTDYPAVKDLNPELVLDGQCWVLATRLIAAVRRSKLRRVGNVADQGDRINRAVDVLMAGV